MDPRSELSKKHLRGSGLEIGACHFPTPLFEGASAVYVDLVEDPKTVNPNAKELNHVVDDAETLSKFGDETFNFLVANHVLEHCQDVIKTLNNWFRILNKDGIAFIALPDKVQTFDKHRAVTPFSHLLIDHYLGPKGSQREHYIDWFSNYEHKKLRGQDLADAVDTAILHNSNVHFHVWDEPAMKELFETISILSNRFFVLESLRNGAEIIWILKKL